MRHVSVIVNSYDSYEFALRLSLKIIRKIGWWQEREGSIAQWLRRQSLVSELGLNLISILYRPCNLGQVTQLY